MPRCFASAQASRKQRAVSRRSSLVTDSRRLEARQHNPGNAHVGGTVHGGGQWPFPPYCAVRFRARRSCRASGQPARLQRQAGCRIAPPLLSIAAVCPATTAENLPPQNPNRAGSHRSPLPSAPCSMTEIAQGVHPITDTKQYGHTDSFQKPWEGKRLSRGKPLLQKAFPATTVEHPNR